jgi:hypothetical protein
MEPDSSMVTTRLGSTELERNSGRLASGSSTAWTGKPAQALSAATTQTMRAFMATLRGGGRNAAIVPVVVENI